MFYQCSLHSTTLDTSEKMGFLLHSALTEFLILIITSVLVVYGFFQNRYKYWTKKGVPVIPPRFPFGNNKILLPKGFTIGVYSKTFYDYFRSRGHKFGGVYLVTEPNLFLVDPEYIKDILSKDFQHFVDRGFYFNEKDDPVSCNLFSTDGAHWRQLRLKLTPTFTSSKMKMMFQNIKECCDYMLEAINKNLDRDLDIKELLARYTTDVIGSCIFGIECNSFKHPDAEFRQMGLKIFQFDFHRSLRAFFIANIPRFSKWLRLTVNNKEVGDFFIKLVCDTIKYRQETQNRRNDFLQILIDMRETEKVSLNEMAAQVFLFFTAGFESSSTVMTFALYHLALNPKYQERLREEISQVLEKHNNELTYENLSEMKYLDQVLDETMRLYPPGSTLNRRCVKDYTLRDTNITIEKGTYVLMSAYGLHMDPEYFPEPEKFDPDRFSETTKETRHPFVFLPFGDGPRNCIGLRFGKMQSKIGVASVIRRFKLTVSPNTKPIELDQNSFIIRSINKVYLRAESL